MISRCCFKISKISIKSLHSCLQYTYEYKFKFWMRSSYGRFASWGINFVTQYCIFSNKSVFLAFYGLQAWTQYVFNMWSDVSFIYIRCWWFYLLKWALKTLHCLGMHILSGTVHSDIRWKLNRFPDLSHSMWWKDCGWLSKSVMVYIGCGSSLFFSDFKVDQHCYVRSNWYMLTFLYK